MKDGLHSPERFPVVLMECFLAGFQHHEAGKYWDRLPIGEEAALVREPGNPHDPRAVRVDWLGATLGYLPREANFAIAQMLDRGATLGVRIAGKRPDGDPKTRMLLEVFLEADPVAGALHGLYDTRPEDTKPELKAQPIVEEFDADVNKLLVGLAWMMAGKVIKKAKGAPANR